MVSPRLTRSPERFVQELETELDQRRSDFGINAFKRQKLRSVVVDCGWRARSVKRLQQLQQDLETAGIFPFPELDDPEVGLNDWIRFSKSPGVDRPLGKIFGTEAGIQHFVYRYYKEVFAGLPGLAGLELVDREMRLLVGREQRKADLVFRDPEGLLVVVEFKRGDPVLGAPNQIREYMDALRGAGKPVGRGILITAKPRSEKLERLIRHDIDSQASEYPIDWYWYSVEVHLEPVMSAVLTAEDI